MGFNMKSNNHVLPGRFRKIGSKLAVGATALVPAFAFAQATTPGSAIASELSTGKSDVMLVVGAAAIILGVLVLWSYVKRAR